MTTTTVPSAYPPAIETLIPRAEALVKELGTIPSQNRLKRELRVGVDKAKAIREALQRNDFTTTAPATPDTTPDPVPTAEATDPAPVDEPTPVVEVPEASPLPTGAAEPDFKAKPVEVIPTVRAARRPTRKPVAWPVLLLALPAFVAIWSGWVELGELAGFGVVHPLPGIADSVKLNTAITLPIGVETYAAYALWVWLSGRAPRQATRFAKWSAIGSLIVGAAGQVAYHLMAAAGVTAAPWLITTAVACLPVAVLGMGAALAHLLHADNHDV